MAYYYIYGREMTLDTARALLVSWGFDIPQDVRKARETLQYLSDSRKLPVDVALSGENDLVYLGALSCTHVSIHTLNKQHAWMDITRVTLSIQTNLQADYLKFPEPIRQVLNNPLMYVVRQQ